MVILFIAEFTKLSIKGASPISVPIYLPLKVFFAILPVCWRSIKLGCPWHYLPYSYAVSSLLNVLYTPSTPSTPSLPTSHRTHDTIAHESTTTHSSSRSSSSLTDGEDSTGTGVHLSPLSATGSQDYTDSLEEETEGWVLYPDEIGPSESASRPRTSHHHHRPVVEVSRPESSRRHHPARRQGPHDRANHHSHTRTQRSQPPIVQGSVESNEEWQAYGHGHGRGPHPPRSYQHWGHVAGHVGGPVAGHVTGHVSGNPPQTYAPSYSSSQTYSPFPTSSLNPQTQQLVPFANPQTGYGYSPYQTATSGTTPGYYSTGHPSGPALGGHMAAHAATPYNSQAGAPYNQELGHHPSAAYYPYSMQGYPVAQPMGPPMFHQYGIYSPPMLSTTPPPPPPPPPPVDPSKDDEKFARLEKLLMDQKAEQDAKEAAAKKAAEDQAAEAIAKKKIADDIAAAAAAAAAAATSEAEKKAAIQAAKNMAAAELEAAKHRAAAEKAAEEMAVVEKQKAEIEKAAAEKAAIEKAIADKAAAEKAAAQKAAAEKAAVEKAAAEVADQVTAAASAAATAASAAATAAAAAATPPPPPPPPAEKKKPIKFKDAVGRKFSFPFHLCNTWMVSDPEKFILVQSVVGWKLNTDLHREWKIS